MSPRRHYSGHCKTAEEDGEPQTPVRGIWSEKCGQPASETAEQRWREQHKTKPDGVKWSTTLGAIRYNSSK